jgi:hypothetical protein
MKFPFITIILCFLAQTELYCEEKRDHQMESSKYLENAVENYMWGAGEIAIGVAEICRGDPLGGALVIADGLRNCKAAWSELQESLEEKKLAENQGVKDDK